MTSQATREQLVDAALRKAKTDHLWASQIPNIEEWADKMR